MHDPKFLNDSCSSIYTAETTRTSLEVYLGEISRKRSLEDGIHQDESDDDVEQNKNVGDDVRKHKKETLSPDSEPSRSNRCLNSCRSFSNRCLKVCRIDFMVTNIRWKMVIPLVYIAVSIVVVSLIFLFEDKIHRNLNTNLVEETTQKPWNGIRYPLL